MGQRTCGAPRRACLALGALSLPLIVQPSQAAEYALGNYLLGFSIPMSGYTPPPGVYFEDAFYFYRGTANANITFPRGNILATGITERFAINIATLSWFTPADFLGGTFGLAAAVPYGNVRVSADVALTGPLGVERQLNRTDSTTGFGQPALSAILGWEHGNHHWNVTLSGFVPAGDYDANSLAIVSLNRPSVDVKGGYTWLDTKTGTEVSAALGVTFNMINPATNYLTGEELHFEAAWQQHYPNGLSFGLGGYYYQQLTGDSGSGARLGPFKGRVLALGPLASYTFKVGETPIDLGAHWFQEFDTENRVRGYSILASVTVPIWNPKSAATKAVKTKY